MTTPSLSSEAATLETKVHSESSENISLVERLKNYTLTPEAYKTEYARQRNDLISLQDALNSHYNANKAMIDGDPTRVAAWQQLVSELNATIAQFGTLLPPASYEPAWKAAQGKKSVTISADTHSDLTDEEFDESVLGRMQVKRYIGPGKDCKYYIAHIGEKDYILRVPSSSSSEIAVAAYTYTESMSNGEIASDIATYERQSQGISGKFSDVELDDTSSLSEAATAGAVTGAATAGAVTWWSGPGLLATTGIGAAAGGVVWAGYYLAGDEDYTPEKMSAQIKQQLIDAENSAK